MRKTNEERAGDIWQWWWNESEGNPMDLKYKVTRALNKAEKRGRRKACPCCKPAPQSDAEGVKQDGDALLRELGLEDDADNQQPAPQFDAKKALKIIHSLKYFERRAYSNDDDCGDLFHACFCDEVIKLLTALGIDDGR